MPADYIRPSLRNLKVDQLRGLKAQYGVSMVAIVERAYRMGFMPAKQRTSIYKMFNARGWRTNEPGSDSLPPEVPRLLSAIAADLAETGHPADEVASIAGHAGPEHNWLLTVPSQHRLRAL
jgi:Zn-dependent peptidase ImmA (M78 family)